MDSNYTISNDIYSMREVIEDIKNHYIEEEDDSRLEIGLEAFISATMAKLGTSSINAMGAMCNEMFPAKARLTSSILRYAYSYNIDGINAKAAVMPVLFCIVQSDLEKIFINQESETEIVIDNNCPFNVGEYEYHFDYPILIQKNILHDNIEVYTARYDMTLSNPASNITNPYLPSPYLVRRGGVTYLYISCQLRQVSVSKVINKVLSTNEIYNKNYTFTFENQLANFTVTITRGDQIIELTNVYYGASTPIDDKVPYCYYEYISKNTVKVTFDEYSAYYPQINDVIKTTIQTTNGAECEFEYNKSILSVLKNTDNYVYNSIQTMIIPQGASAGGADAKTVAQLKKLIPRERTSRGNLTNNDDLNNYFNTYNTDTFHFEFVRKADNQAFRIYYGYVLAKDSSNKVIPTNTISFKVRMSALETITTSSGSKVYLLNTGTVIGYKSTNGIYEGEVIPKDLVQDKRDNYEFLYTIPFKVILDADTTALTYFITLIDTSYPTIFTYINNQSPLQFILPKVGWSRPYQSGSYTLSLPLAQNVDDNQHICVDNGDGTFSDNRLMAVAVIYMDGVPYRYFFSELKSVDTSSGFIFNHEIKFDTNDMIDDSNAIRIENGYAASQSTIQYGFFGSNVETKIYILCKFDDGSHGRDDLDAVIPAGTIDDYTVTNKYSINGGLDFFYDLSDQIASNSAVINDASAGEQAFEVSNVPVIKYDYINDQDKYTAFVNTVKTQKEYIDEALKILENQFVVDLKFYNTYGPALLYYVDTDGTEILDKVNINFTFNLSLKKSTDSYTVQYITRDIKNLIEDFSRERQIDIPTIISTINNRYSNSINYIEYRGFNDYGTDYQHLYYPSEDKLNIGDIPEFINIDTDDEGQPVITINLV